MKPPYIFHTRFDIQIVELLADHLWHPVVTLSKKLRPAPTPSTLRTEILNLHKAGVVETEVKTHWMRQGGIVERQGMFGGGGVRKQKELRVRLAPAYIKAAKEYRDWWRNWEEEHQEAP
jgi:hypothetical protein